MSVIIDTSVWSLYVRRKRRQLRPEQRSCVEEVRLLLREGRALMPGPIRQELLSGIHDDVAFERIRLLSEGVPDLPVERDDYVEAARLSNRCRDKGVAGAPIDVLVCAMGLRRDLPVFSTDADFDRFEALLKIRRHRPTK
ncbi:MAG: PIN domain-containing protein [Planctomycetes bacterium]|nr:PIN domain-containing protein [Planctomycetota bacterium]